MIILFCYDKFVYYTNTHVFTNLERDLYNAFGIFIIKIHLNTHSYSY